MKGFITLLIGLALVAIGPGYAAAPQITITFTPSDEQFDVFKLIINRKCSRLLAQGANIPGFCAADSPSPGLCTCTPNANQAAAAIKDIWIDDQFVHDRRQMYRDYGEELVRRFADPSTTKEARDACGNALGMPFLLP